MIYDITPEEAYDLAKCIPNCDIGEYQEIACQDPQYAFWFAKYIPGADISYCQKYACKDYMWAHWFATNIYEADIEYCYRLFEYLGKDIKRFILDNL